MEKELINQLLLTFNEQLFTLMFKFVIIGVIIMLLKNIIESVTGYILLMTNKYVCIGSPVEIYGKKGRIKRITLFSVTIETECGYIRTSTKDWRTSKYISLKDHLTLLNRRSTDIKTGGIKS